MPTSWIIKSDNILSNSFNLNTLQRAENTEIWTDVNWLIKYLPFCQAPENPNLEFYQASSRWMTPATIKLITDLALEGASVVPDGEAAKEVEVAMDNLGIVKRGRIALLKGDQLNVREVNLLKQLEAKLNQDDILKIEALEVLELNQISETEDDVQKIIDQVTTPPQDMTNGTKSKIVEVPEEVRASKKGSVADHTRRRA